MPGITHQEKALLDGHNFTFKPLMKSKQLHFGQVMTFTVKVAAIFMIELTVLSWYERYKYGNELSIALAVIAAIAFLFWPVLLFVCMIQIACLPKDHRKEARFAGHMYWFFWPTWTLFWIVVSLILGVVLGQYIWKDLHTYYELTELRPYRGINPAKIPGKQIEDAGVVTFASGVGIERGKGGCFVNGRTYCVAPIAMDSRVGDNVEHGTHDFFAVGVDCCDCPSSTFRCGDWNSPYANGGLRSVDVLGRAYYKLAVQEWEARTNVQSANPLFFRWTDDAEFKYKMLFERSMHIYTLAMVGAAPLMCCVALILTIGLQQMKEMEIAHPNGHPPNPSHPLLRWVLNKAHPELHEHLNEYERKEAKAAKYNSI